MALPPVDPELELERRAEVAKARLRLQQSVLRMTLENKSATEMAQQLGMDRKSVYRWLYILGLAVQPNQHSRSGPFDVLPWRRRFGARGET